MATSPYSSTSSSSSFMPHNGSRSTTPNNFIDDSQPLIDFPSMDDQQLIQNASADSISVTIRFRPLSEREYNRGDGIAWYPDGDKLVRNEYNPMTSYAFDKVFGPDTVTPEVYEVAAQPVVKAAMDGINGTVFAYGVTSSGKTHTMHGDQNSPGIIPLAIKDVFSIIQDTPGREFLLRVSYLEIYNEVINDLLDPTGQNLRVREDAQGTYVEGIKEEVVLSPGHALSFIAAGEEHRHVGSNNFNLFSSRSHTIFTLMIESSALGDDYDGVIYSQLNLIDLAGSESSKTETTGLRRKEGSYINKSLLTLGTVIGKLSEGKAAHVPFRDSKLTRLLQSSLSGHGHVSLICTITPASSNFEETHNTLKFASRAKHVEIYASRNMIIDEKSLIKKYQREISCLRDELDQLRRGVLVGVNHEEVMVLKQQLEEGQVKMQSRLEEEEEAKTALMSRIQRLTKLILVSSKNNVPEDLDDPPLHQRSHSALENDDEVSTADQMDLLVEQVKMLAGEIAFSTSTLKRLVDQSVNDPESSKPQIENLENEIQEKRKQMRILELRIVVGGQVSGGNAYILELQQTVKKLSAQCNEKIFELEIMAADNRVLQDQLENKCAENKELQEKNIHLEQQLASASGNRMPSPSEQRLSDQNDGLRKKVQSQEFENEKLKLEHVQTLEENTGLHVQNQKLSEEASYAKELASAAAAELKNLASEVTKLSIQNAKLEKELHASHELISRNSNHKQNDARRPGLRGKISNNRSYDFSGMVNDNFKSWDLDRDDLKMELLARKQREASLEAALAEKEILENEYRKKFDDAKKREVVLENDLANMWVLVAQLKKEGSVVQEPQLNSRRNEEIDRTSEVKVDDVGSRDLNLKEREGVEHLTIKNDIPKEEPLVVRLKARMKEMKEKELRYSSNGDSNSHVCKVCFESATAAMLLPCRHFCLCKACSLACSECPICRTSISDRIIAFT